MHSETKIRARARPEMIVREAEEQSCNLRGRVSFAHVNLSRDRKDLPLAVPALLDVAADLTRTFLELSHLLYIVALPCVKPTPVSSTRHLYGNIQDVLSTDQRTWYRGGLIKGNGRSLPTLSYSECLPVLSVGSHLVSWCVAHSHVHRTPNRGHVPVVFALRTSYHPRHSGVTSRSGPHLHMKE